MDVEIVSNRWNTRANPPAADKLAAALRALIADLDDRAKWMHFTPAEDGKTVPCGAGAYANALKALAEFKEG